MVIKSSYKIRRIAAASLMGILLMPIIIVICWQLEKVQLFKTIEERFEHHPSVTIKVPVDKIVWIKKNREILFNGSMFDVSTIKTGKEYALITGHFDEEENEINKQISMHAAPGQENKSATVLGQYLRIFIAVFKQDCYNYTIEEVELKIDWNTQMDKKLTSISLKIVTPPPDSAALV